MSLTRDFLFRFQRIKNFFCENLFRQRRQNIGSLYSSLLLSLLIFYRKRQRECTVLTWPNLDINIRWTCPARHWCRVARDESCPAVMAAARQFHDVRRLSEVKLLVAKQGGASPPLPCWVAFQCRECLCICLFTERGLIKGFFSVAVDSQAFWFEKNVVQIPCTVFLPLHFLSWYVLKNLVQKKLVLVFYCIESDRLVGTIFPIIGSKFISSSF